MKYLYIIMGALALCAGIWLHGNYHGKKTERLATADAAIEAIEKARQEEQAKQEEINRELQSQNESLAAINNQLNTDIERLHQRESRRHMPKATPTQCQGASGTALSREDAGFLVREAARADRLREALRTCYSYADKVSGTPNH